MKKYILLFLIVLIISAFIACSNQEKSGYDNTYSSQTVLEDDTGSSDRAGTAESIHTNISEVYISAFNLKYSVGITQETIDLIERSKTAESPELSEDMSEIGKLIIVYENEDSETEFGTIYIDSENRTYLMCSNNEHHAVVELEQFTESERTTSVTDRFHEIYEKYNK